MKWPVRTRTRKKNKGQQKGSFWCLCRFSILRSNFAWTTSPRPIERRNSSYKCKKTTRIDSSLTLVIVLEKQRPLAGVDGGSHRLRLDGVFHLLLLLLLVHDFRNHLGQLLSELSSRISRILKQTESAASSDLNYGRRGWRACSRDGFFSSSANFGASSFFFFLRSVGQKLFVPKNVAPIGH